MKLPTRLLVGAAAMLGVAAASGQPEFVLPAFLLAGGATLAHRAARRKELAPSRDGEPLENRLAEMEKRLSVTEGELEAANVELEQLRVEREFDRQLLRAPNTPRDP